MELPPANDRAIKTTWSNGMKLRLIETRLLTTKRISYKADTTPPRSRTQNISLCFLISISAVILKVMLKLTSISPRDLGESLRRRRRRRRRSAFIYHTFIHTHTSQRWSWRSRRANAHFLVNDDDNVNVAFKSEFKFRTDPVKASSGMCVRLTSITFPVV